MAADDDDREQAPDPWDEIVAESLGEEAGEVSFQFEEASSAVPPPSDATADPAEAAADAEASAEAAADAMLDDWLSAADTDSATPPLAVFDPGEAASGSSDIDIGTGGSGVGLQGPAEQEEIGADAFTAAEIGAEGAADGWPVADEHPAGEAAGVEGSGESLPAAAGAAAPAHGVAATPPARRPAQPVKKKSGSIGQLIGVVLGGVMAIPITLAILIYGLGKDPFGVTKQVPDDAAFLLPHKFRPGSETPRTVDSEIAGESALDSLPAVTETAEPAVETNVVSNEPSSVEPPDVATPDADMPPSTDVAAVDAPGLDAPTLDALGLDAPGLDALGLDALGAQPAPTAPAEPPPLDTAALDAAVGDATALGEALGVVDDLENGASIKLRTSWYRALARVAEELVAVENAAATSGQPLAGAPDSVNALHDVIGRRERLAAELAALAPDWLAYAKRGSDGIVAPVTFESARRVGPYWALRASLIGSDGQPRNLTIISRNEPTAIAGDRVVVTGVALDGAVIWAADVRTTGGDGAAGF